MVTKRLGICGALFLVACGGSTSKPNPPTPTGGAILASDSTGAASSSTGSTDATGPTNATAGEFKIRPSETAGSAHGVSKSKIKATATHAAMKFFVVDKGKDEPIAGIVISLQAPDGSKYYTDETDALGYGEVLVPVGQEYDLVYLTLGRKDITAKVKVENEPNQNIKLTLRYKPREPMITAAPPSADEQEEPLPAPTFRLEGVTFDTGSSELLPESYERLDSVAEYLTYKKSARIEVSGHTDSVGPKAANKKLSQKRAEACKAYLVGKGVDGSRIEAIGHGGERPLASNKTAEGRRQNRRIEAKEL